MKALQRADKVEAGAKGNAAQGKKSSAIAAGDSDYRRAIGKASIPERTARRWQEVADVPEDRFEVQVVTRVQKQQ
jgi:hypothetical protein